MEILLILFLALYFERRLSKREPKPKQKLFSWLRPKDPKCKIKGYISTTDTLGGQK